MQFITTTDLRTKSTQLVSALQNGETVSLIHRSKFVGEIMPKKADGRIFDAKKFAELVGELGLLSISHKQRQRIYGAHLEKKYGKNISGR